MKKLTLTFATVCISACAGTPVDQNFVAPLESRSQLHYAVTSNKDVGLSRGVLEIIDSEGEIATNDARLACEVVTRTGSHRVQRLCRTKDEVEAESRAAQRHLNRLLRQSQRESGLGAQ